MLRVDLDGLRMQIPGEPAIYLIDNGFRRHIPDPDTYNNLFRNWDNIVQDVNLNEIDEGIPISVGAILARAIDQAPVFLIDARSKRHVGSPAVMDRYQFNWDKISVVPHILLDSIATGTPVVNP